VSQWEQKLNMNGRRHPHSPYPLAAVPTMSIRKKNGIACLMHYLEETKVEKAISFLDVV
jgi:hypothetical protein